MAAAAGRGDGPVNCTRTWGTRPVATAPLSARRGIAPRIARRGSESRKRLGRYRWVVERGFAWLHRNRRLLVRYERDPALHDAFLHLGCALICWQVLQHGP